MTRNSRLGISSGWRHNVAMKRLQDKVAIVTGGSLGIGRAACQLFAQEGAKVAICDVRYCDGKDLVDDIISEGGIAGFWKMDVADENSVKTTVDDVVRRWGKLDVLVNNAGISGINKPTHEVSLEDWNRVISVNVTGVFNCTKFAIPYLKKNGKGSIINLSSIYGLVSAPDVPPYHASKGAVRLMTKTDALLYAADGIRVNSVHPGFIWTPMVENHLKGSNQNTEEGRAAVAALHPLGHMGEPMDIAYGLLYLASDESNFVTGSELVIDGGYTAR